MSGSSEARDDGRATHTYVELDGLRGVAALAVVLMHMHALFGAAGDVLDRHAYLAVDFFMMLSGFVIAYAYEDRLRHVSARRGFFIDRMIRLYPLLILGSAVGFVSAVMTPDYDGLGKSLIYLLAGCMPFPVPPLGDAWAAFPLNFPTWSLFWEVVLNIVMAFAALYVTTRRLLLVVALCFVGTLALGVQHGSIDIGAKFLGVIGSAPRMVGEFAGGVLLLRVHRAGWFAHGGVRWWVPMVVVGCFYLLPKEHELSLVFDMVAISAILPVCILLAAGSQSAIPAVAGFSGSISYPLYILHIPVAGLVAYAYARSDVPPRVTSGCVAVMIVIVAAYLAYGLYDRPLRTMLRGRFGSRRHRDIVAGDVQVT